MSEYTLWQGGFWTSEENMEGPLWQGGGVSGRQKKIWRDQMHLDVSGISS